MFAPLPDGLKKEDFTDVLAYLEHETGQHIRPVYIMDGHGLTMKGINFELTVRLEHDTLFITRIEMPLHRHGQGSRILELLKAYARGRGLKHIAVEHTTTHEIVAFCHKHGFRPMLIGCIEIEHGEFYGNYVLDI